MSPDKPFTLARLGCLAAALSTAMFVLCAEAPAQQAGLHDSAHTVALDALIPKGELLSGNRKSRYIPEIRKQLRYAIGQLNAIGGAPELGLFEITVTGSEPLNDGSGLTRVFYEAHGVVMWPRERRRPFLFELKLPARADSKGEAGFFQEFKPTCKDNTGTSTLYNFWYHYRPENPGCPLASSLGASSLRDPRRVSRPLMQLKPSSRQTEGRFPEYGKIWEDGKLTATLIFGKNKPFAGDEDAGSAAYRLMERLLILNFGAPLSRTETDLPSKELVFIANNRRIEVNLHLIEGMQHLSRGFVRKYQERTRTSDLVAYNGHAGLGENIQALIRLSRFTPGLYQLFMLNGCDTFAYIDDALWSAHGAINPRFAPSKHLDVISNAMPSYFGQNAAANIKLIHALIYSRKTYREILEGFDIRQRAVVTGEEDNRWPAAF